MVNVGHAWKVGPEFHITLRNPPWRSDVRRDLPFQAMRSARAKRHVPRAQAEVRAQGVPSPEPRYVHKVFLSLRTKYTFFFPDKEARLPELVAVGFRGGFLDALEPRDFFVVVLWAVWDLLGFTT